MQLRTISPSDCDIWRKVEFIWQAATTKSVVGPRRSSKALFKAKFTSKPVVVPVWWSAASLIHHNFLNPDETTTSEKYAQQINEIHQELQCLQLSWSTERAQFFPATTRACTSHNQCFKRLGYEVLPPLPHSPVLSPSLLQTYWQLLARKMLPQPAGCRKCFPRVHWVLKHGFLCYWQKCVDCNGSDCD